MLEKRYVAPQPTQATVRSLPSSCDYNLIKLQIFQLLQSILIGFCIRCSL